MQQSTDIFYAQSSFYPDNFESIQRGKKDHLDKRSRKKHKNFRELRKKGRGRSVPE